MKTLPLEGRTAAEISASLERLRRADLQRRSGKSFGYAYEAGAEAVQVVHDAHATFLPLNGLDPTLFPSLAALENDLVAMFASHLGGGEQTVGTFTSGGTESIILAVKAARDHCRATRPQVERPQLVLAQTAHAAFHKAAHYLDLQTVVVPVDATTFCLDVEAARQAICDDTVLLVGSAPSYAHGVIDPIVELGELALDKGLLLHVDACIGGVLLPFFARLDTDLPRFDLSVPGVTSMSVDLHKYGYAAKGASLVLYNDPALRRQQFFACAEWTGYSAVNTALQGSKSGGPLAAAWAVAQFLGQQGFEALTGKIKEAMDVLLAGIEGTQGLRVLGQPKMSLLAFAAEDIDIFALADELKARGYHIQAQLSYGASPANLHLTVTPINVQAATGFVADLRELVETLRTRGPDAELQGVRQMLAGLDFDGVDGESLWQMMTMAGIGEGGLPERMAVINTALDALPPRVREMILLEYFDRLFRPAQK